MRISFLLFLLSFSTILCSQELISTRQVADGFSIPVDISFDHTNRMYVVEKRGTIRFVDSDGSNKLFLDITSKVNSGANERGLLGLAFHPEYKSNGYFFVNYTNSTGATVIARYKLKENDVNSADASSEKKIITISQPFNNHNGGDLNFGKDGYLYIGMGDGGSGGDPSNYSQNPKDLLGKMLRIDINTESAPYLIPVTNPYKTNADTLPEIWSVGLRNPWRFSFDKNNNDLWIADVGQNKSEEVNKVINSPKLNFGWRCYEGNLKYNFANCDDSRGYVKPVHTYTTSSSGDGCSITGGYVYRGDSISLLSGNYVFGDFCTGNIWMLSQGANGEYTRQKIYKTGPQELSTFGQDNNGEIYYAELGNGAIQKIMNKCSKRIESVETVPVACEEATSGKVLFNIVGNENYTISLSNGNPPLDQLKKGIYTYKLTDEKGCEENGSFEIKVEKKDIEFEVDFNPVQLCEQGVYCFNLNKILPNPDSVIVQYGIGPIFYKVTKDTICLYNQTGISEAYLEGCKYSINSTFGVTFDKAKTPAPELVSSSDTLIVVKGNYTSYFITNMTNVVFEKSTNGKFTKKYKDGTYLIYGVDADGCHSLPLTVDILSNINDEITFPLTLIPNPAKEIITVETEGFIKADIYSINGEKLILSANTKQISLHPLTSGMYLIKVETSNGKVAKTFVKM